MSQETDGTNTPATPPSFVPAATRKRRSPQDMPPAKEPRGSRESSASVPEAGEPARFTPQAKRRSSSSKRSAQQASHSSRQSSRQTPDKSSQQLPHQTSPRHDDAHAAPSAPSFQPARSSRTVSHAPSPQTPRTARRSAGSTSQAGSAAQQASSRSGHGAQRRWIRDCGMSEHALRGPESMAKRAIPRHRHISPEGREAWVPHRQTWSAHGLIAAFADCSSPSR